MPVKSNAGAAVTAEEVREHLAEVLDRAAVEGERIIVTRGGEALAAVVPLKDVEFLEQIEDRLDAEDFRAAREDWIRDGGRAKRLDQIVRKLEIKL